MHLGVDDHRLSLAGPALVTASDPARPEPTSLGRNRPRSSGESSTVDPDFVCEPSVRHWDVP
ncbi:hypothetical protein ALI22I_44325 [Saccharothrix sp. ALI-22-I]|nr:hypothetical protein ALI22I_44325 [Saccharothrix sp. ALI-22-I]